MTTVTTTTKKVVIRKSVFSAEQKGFIQQMRKEIIELLASERDYFAVEEEYLCLEAELKREEQELQTLQMEFQIRHEADGGIIESLRREIEDQRNILSDKKEQNLNLRQELTA